jgi:glycosyltransferase involved in cell wall biosynthesis
MRILIGTIEISGIATELCAGLRDAGIDAQTVFRLSHQFSYDRTPVIPWVVRFWQYLGGLRASSRSAPLRFVLKGTHFIWGFLVLLWAVRRFDVFLFLFGTGITDTTLELRLLRFLKKKLIFFYVGSDERPPFMNGVVTLHNPEPTLADLDRLSRRKKRQIQRCERYADFCIGSPFSGQFHSRPFVKCFSLGIPKHRETVSLVPGAAEPRTRVRIVHAPSQSESKGSAYIVGMVERLRAKGHAFDFVKLEGVPNSHVIAEISRCDFIVDQLFSDTPMAAFATEAASLGKPSIVGGYMSMEMRQYLDDEDIPPTMYVHPDEFESAMERMILDADLRRDLGRRAREFVATRWSRAEITQRYLRLFNGDIPENWWFDPQDIRYVHGYGMPEERLKRLLGELVRTYGLDVLGVSDKPRLQQRFLDLIGPAGKVA